MKLKLLLIKKSAIWYKILTASFSIWQYIVENLKIRAYKHVTDFVAVDARTILGPQRSLMDPQVEQLNSPTSILQHHEFPVAQGIWRYSMIHYPTFHFRINHNLYFFFRNAAGFRPCFYFNF